MLWSLLLAHTSTIELHTIPVPVSVKAVWYGTVLSCFMRFCDRCVTPGRLWSS